MTTDLAKLIFQESLLPSTTWTYKFLSQTQKSVKKLREKDYAKLISSLFEFFLQNSTTSLQKFKISQLISSIVIQNLERSASIIPEYKDSVMKHIETFQDSSISSQQRKLWKVSSIQSQILFRLETIQALAAQ
ncbi:hypothetical protein TVAG_336130 [Trichomonas vaginalis G3]|uniref:Uncharacterized protein n=1 Tax=Trichomonas vaginalis (strain ATCC PRA-98 / G3) TaxID=412133 RepID=A2FN99_TRIV3|nr:hypothetical protein TVAGG3_0795560 [Trichomonas vaginalis G3]EAX93627.1 hypothetical protein TVAG_336130 [Trichomonas vaginalis G3]KAI5496140.1 hypothetical protein TVAGG3_0795560 [Trichomonas vaginalis G3]|eukprot:XP_001306557.1 hypothetical protein [Trichomonas vaginalis G3]